MDLSQVIILSIVEGLTEFIPVSSTGHLIIVEKLFGWKVPFAFDLIIQLGAFCAVLFLFRGKIFKITTATFNFFLHKFTKKSFEEKQRLDARLGISMIIATIPIGILGFIFQNWIEEHLQVGIFVAFALIGFSFVMSYYDKKDKNEKDITATTSGDVIKIGLWQVLSLIPGVSRSGATISGGLSLGLKREAAAEISFILGLPIVILAGLKGFWDIFRGKENVNTELMSILIGFIISFIVGLIAIKLLINFIKKNNFKPFILYRIGLGIFVLLIFLVSGR